MSEIDYKINNFKNHSLKYILFNTPKSFMNYKIAIWWIPITAYIFFMILLTFGFSNISYSYTKLLEFTFCFISYVLYFIIYFITDLVYQSNICEGINKTDIVIISLHNAFNISKFAAIGYFIGIFITDHTTPLLNINYNQNYQINNIITSILTIIFGMFYINPLNRSDCSQNILCKNINDTSNNKDNFTLELISNKLKQKKNNKYLNEIIFYDKFFQTMIYENLLDIFFLIFF